MREILLDDAIQLAAEGICGLFGCGVLGPEALSARQRCVDTRVMSSATGGGTVVLDAQTCWQQLAGEEVGRLAVSVRQHPDIFPVNYTVDDQTIVFRTAEGTKLFALFVDSAVAIRGGRLRRRVRYRVERRDQGTRSGDTDAGPPRRSRVPVVPLDRDAQASLRARCARRDHRAPIPRRPTRSRRHWLSAVRPTV